MNADRLIAALLDAKLPSGVHYAVRGAAVATVILASVATLAGRSGPVQAPPEEPIVVATAPAPVVSSVTIKKIQASAEPQVLTFVGTSFVKGMTARLVSPFEEVISTFPASALEQVTPTSFQLRAELEEPGAYELTVRSPDGQRSNALRLDVQRPPVRRAAR